MREESSFSQNQISDFNIRNITAAFSNVISCKNEVAESQTMCCGRRWKEDGPGSSVQKPFCARLEIYPSGKGKGKSTFAYEGLTRVYIR